MRRLESSPDSMLAELSVSFRKDLTTSIQGAFGVAVEIAITEVSKLVAHAFRDLHDRLRETLQTNRELESRLHATESDPHDLRARTDGQTRVVYTNLPVTSDVQVGDLHPIVRSVVAQTLDSDPTEIAWERIVHDHSIKPDVTDYRCGAGQPQTIADTKQDHYSLETSSLDQTPCLTSPKSTPVVSSEAVKTERPDPPCGPEPDLEGLSLAQSKLLEDWRPKTHQIQSCWPDDINNMADPNLFQELAASNPHPQGAPQPQSLDASVPQVDPMSLSRGAPQNLHPTSIPCDVSGPHPSLRRFAGQSVKSLLQDLRWHRTQQRGGSRSGTLLPGRGPYRCSQCNRDFNRLEHLKIHQRIHTGEKPYPCSVCAARFRHSWALTRHLRIHTGEKPYSCSQCGKSFRNCGGLRFHQRNHARDISLAGS